MPYVTINVEQTARDRWVGEFEAGGIVARREKVIATSFVEAMAKVVDAYQRLVELDASLAQRRAAMAAVLGVAEPVAEEPAPVPKFGAARNPAEWPDEWAASDAEPAPAIVDAPLLPPKRRGRPPRVR